MSCTCIDRARGEEGDRSLLTPRDRAHSTRINIDYYYYLPYHHRDDLRIRTIIRWRFSKSEQDQAGRGFLPLRTITMILLFGRRYRTLSPLHLALFFSPFFFLSLLSIESSPTIANSLRGFVEGAQSPENSFFTESPSCLRRRRR